MAENVVQFLVPKLVTLIQNEAFLLGGVSTEISEIKQELETMKAFLKDADRKAYSSDLVDTWVERVRDSAYDVEDIIDEFIYCISSQHGSSTGFFMGCCVHETIICLLKNIWTRHKVATRLQEIKTKIQDISRSSKAYDFNRTIVEGRTTSSYGNPQCLQHHGESSLFIEEDDIVGIEKERELLLKWLMEDEHRRTVSSVYGMGGSGKTTLVSRVYKSQSVKRHFDCYAWITVSQTYNIEDLLRRMIKDFYECKKEALPNELGTMEYKKLVETLVTHLQQKRYVVVLDDVWTIDLWKEIMVALPADGSSGSRVMLTTRKEKIAKFGFGVGCHVHQLQPLKETEAWELFCNKAFSSDPNPNNRGCPLELEKVAQLIVEKCEGLPLAVIAMGGLMSSKNKTSVEWQMVYDSLNYELNNNTDLEVVKSVLLLSYNDLPYFLKNCFLYCCVYPEDYIIRRKRLIKLWIAEGFVEERKGLTIEEVADTYLMELVSRSMIQVIYRNECGSLQQCGMHDVMREIALSISEKENFSMVYDDSNKGGGRHDLKAPRRLSVYKGSSDVSTNDFHASNMSKLRSFFMFNTDIDNILSSSVSGGSSLLPSGFRLLRVLDLEGVPIKSVPAELVDLFNLRYLSLRETLVSELPDSIGRLHNLLTLDIRHSKVKVLPKGIVKLHNLRHLVMYHQVVDGDSQYYNFANGNQVPMDIWKLKNLQELKLIEARGDIIKQIGNMTQLRKVGITQVREADAEDLCSTLRKLSLINYLFVMMVNATEPLRLDAIQSPPPLLQKLIMAGKLLCVPKWFRSLNNLTLLHLHWSQLGEDPLGQIHALPCLGKLMFTNAYNGQKLRICAGWFLKLQTLALRNIQYLTELVIENGAMPKLEKLDLLGCKRLRMVPEGIEHLTKLQSLTLLDMSEELIERVRGEDSIDHQRIRHIPQIDHYYRTPEGWVYESLSLSSSV